MMSYLVCLLIALGLCLLAAVLVVVSANQDRIELSEDESAIIRRMIEQGEGR